MSTESVRTEVQLNPAIRAVEIKITARIEDEDLVLGLLKRAGADAEERMVWFFDTPGLALFDTGVVLRARKKGGGTDDTTVKLRPVDPARIPIDWVKTDGFEIEMDRVGSAEIVSAKLTVDQARGEIDEAVAGERPLRKLFSADQERLIAEFGPATVGWDDLAPMGPIAVRKWTFDPEDLEHTVVAERWTLPDRSDLVELSIKVEPGHVTAAADAFAAFLELAGLDISGDQQTKTRGALTFFATGVGFD